jgi:C-terminal processing protease CtpA/Prc
MGADISSDVVSTINGRPAAELSLTEISKMFKQEGRDYVLDIIRGEERLQLKLKLSRLI